MGRKRITPELSEPQKRSIEYAWRNGFGDHLIAKNPHINVPYSIVNQFRKKSGIASKTITNARYEAWAKAITEGAELSQLSTIYEVKEATIKMQLWKHKKFSFEKVHKQILKENNQDYLAKTRFLNEQVFGDLQIFKI